MHSDGGGIGLVDASADALHNRGNSRAKKSTTHNTLPVSQLNKGNGSPDRSEWAPKPASLVPLHAHGKILMAGVGNRAYVLCYV